MKEIIFLNPEWVKGLELNVGVESLFFNPSGETLYAELAGTLYEWGLQKKDLGPKRWIGE